MSISKFKIYKTRIYTLMTLLLASSNLYADENMNIEGGVTISVTRTPVIKENNIQYTSVNIGQKNNDQLTESEKEIQTIQNEEELRDKNNDSSIDLHGGVKISETKRNTSETPKKEKENEKLIERENKKHIISSTIYDLDLETHQHTELINIKIVDNSNNSQLLSKTYFNNQKNFKASYDLKNISASYTMIVTEYDSTAYFKNVLKITTIKIIYDRKEVKAAFPVKSTKYVQANDPKIVALMESITSNVKGNVQKVLAINKWIADNIVYEMNSKPIDALNVLKSKKTYCMGYANIFAALSRAAGFETKVMTGKASGQYHQWNEVKINGIWYFIDTTWNASPKLTNKSLYFTTVNNYPKSHKTRFGPKEVKSY